MKNEIKTKQLTHIDSQGNPQMVNVGEKKVIKRRAHARSKVSLPQEILNLIQNDEIQSKKGPVFQTAIIAGTMAAKKTGELIPLCHPLALEDCKFSISIDENQQVVVDCQVSIHAKTGVEMEALVGASMAALTIYDMCKAMSQKIVISETKLISKEKFN